MVRDDVLRKGWYLSKEDEISSHAHKTGSWYPLGVLVKISKFGLEYEFPRLFLYIGVLPGVKKIVGKVCSNPFEHVQLPKLNE